MTTRCANCQFILTSGMTCCPSCGRRRPTFVKFAAICFAGLFVLLFVAALLAPRSSTGATSQSGQAQPSPVHTARHARLGEIVTAKREASPCGSTPEAFDEIVKWAVAGDTQEMFRVIATTGSSLWTRGSQAKVLDSGGFLYDRTKIRILSPEPAGYVAAEECWVTSEAVAESLQ